MERQECSAAGPRVTGLNHLTLAVADVERSLRFYRDVLGFRPRALWPDGAYLAAGDLWLCLSRDEAARERPHADYTHVAFSVAAEHFDALSARVRDEARIWRDNLSEGCSLYCLDPDGHKLEIHVGGLESRLAHYRAHPRPDRSLFDEGEHPISTSSSAADPKSSTGPILASRV